jgi:hypothetical protein
VRKTIIAIMSAAATATTLPTHAHARQVLVALMLGDDEEESVHYQAVKDCPAFIASVRKNVKTGQLPINLTFEAHPKFTGRVKEATCIKEDGSIGEQIKNVPTTKETKS